MRNSDSGVSGLGNGHGGEWNWGVGRGKRWAERKQWYWCNGTVKLYAGTLARLVTREPLSAASICISIRLGD